jgi:serine/threonine protein kinase/Flp pilus assembly protein TadD
VHGSSRSVEELVEEFHARRRRGEPIGASDYAAEHPELGTELLDALEALEVLEGMRPAPASAGELEGQEQIGAFRLVREIGRGGMGVVFEAIEVTLGRRVALKLLPPDGLGRSARARFQREAELASRLDHPNICTVYAAGVESDRPWIAMRFVEGETLGSAILRAREKGERGITLAREGSTGRSRQRSVAACFARVARALAYAHERGVVHRDVKPSNVMVTPAGEPVLLDFGLAREEESDAPSLTRTGETAGTPAYLAPELLAGEIEKPDARVDVYALGVSLYECLALRQPFVAPTRMALYHAILAGSAPGLKKQDPEIPRDLAVVVATAMERERSRRYATAADLAADLEAVVEGRPIAARPASSLGRALRWARREPRQALLVALLVTASLALAVAGGVLLASRDDVLAAERATRAKEVEEAVVSGYAALPESLQGEGEAADAAFARALAMDPACIEAQAGAVLVRIARGKNDEALERLSAMPDLPVFERLRSMAGGQAIPEDPEWIQKATALELFVEGLRLQIESDYCVAPTERHAISRRALEMLNEAVIRAPSARSLYHMTRAYAAGAAEDAAAAQSAAAALLALWPDSEHELFVAGSALHSVDPAASRDLLDRVTALNPSCGPAYHNLGTAYLLLDEPEAAESAFRDALELLPREHHSWNGLGLALVDEGRWEEARTAYYHALDLAPDFVEALKNLGNLEARSEDFGASVQLLSRAVELDPADMDARCNYGYSLYYLGELDRAREQFEYIVTREPAYHPAPWAGLSRVLASSGSPEEALDVAERGLVLHPDDEDLLAVRDEARKALGLGD